MWELRNRSSFFKNVNRNAEFTPLEDRIGIVRIGRREMNLTSFFLGVYVSIYYLKNQIIYDKL